MTHGSFYMFGAYLIAVTFDKLDHSMATFALAILVSAAVVFAIGVIIELVILRRLYDGEHLLQLLATWALMLIFEELALDVWGSATVTAPHPPLVSGSFSLGNATIPMYDVFLIIVAVIIFVALGIFTNRMHIGRLLRAAVEDHELLETLGINVRQLYTVAFGVGAFLAAVGGAVIAPQISVGPGIDLSILVESFVVAVVGGLGNIKGAAIGAIIIGIAETFGSTYFPSVSEATIYIVMVVVLIVRPQGLLSREEL